MTFSTSCRCVQIDSSTPVASNLGRMRPDFLVFDYDGVIIDSTPPIIDAAAKLHDWLGLYRAPEHESAARRIGTSPEVSVPAFCDAYGIDPARRPEVARFMFEAYTTAARTMTATFPGVL